MNDQVNKENTEDIKGRAGGSDNSPDIANSGDPNRGSQQNVPSSQQNNCTPPPASVILSEEHLINKQSEMMSNAQADAQAYYNMMEQQVDANKSNASPYSLEALEARRKRAVEISMMEQPVDGRPSAQAPSYSLEARKQMASVAEARKRLADANKQPVGTAPFSLDARKRAVDANKPSATPSTFSLDLRKQVAGPTKPIVTAPFPLDSTKQPVDNNKAFMHSKYYKSSGTLRAEDDMDLMQKEADDLVTKLTEEEDQRPKMKQTMQNDSWYYRDPQRVVQGR